MSKYVIELNSDYIKSIVAFGMMGDKGISMVFKIDELEELNSDYINEHFGDLQDTAYQRGLSDGNDIGYKDGVKDGQNEAWEAARKVAEMWETIDNDELLGIFGLTAKIGESTIGTLFKKQTASEAIAKLKAYEEKQKADNDKFEFGDEIIDSNGVKGCVISMNNEKSNTMYALFGGYRVPQCICQKNYRKTGKHYDVDDINKLLEEMRHD